MQISHLAKVPPDWHTLEDPNFPFTDAHHLSALHQTGCLGDATGWYPIYVCCYLNEQLIAGMPCYLKTNSYGEFIFDHAWAQACMRHGLDYYPKWISAVPFTPATGPKILLKHTNPGNKENIDLATKHLVLEAKSMASKNNSFHSLFLPSELLQPWVDEGFTRRTSFQFHWFNLGWNSFSDFTDSLVSKRRRQIVLERKQIASEGLTFHVYTDVELTQELADFIFELYRDTNKRMGSHVCLTRGYFEETFKTMKNTIVVFCARRDGKLIAGAINYHKGDHMFGRYWGTTENVRNLHFELCYYMAIDYCLTHNVKKYEAGAQGEHKVARGFIPTKTWSAHDLSHGEIKSAVSHFCEQENYAVVEHIKSYLDSPVYKETHPNMENL